MHPSTKVKRWAAYLRQIRQFLDSRGFFEVSTDNLVPAGAFEGTIDVLTATYSGGQAELHTSPEIEMKRVIAQAGLPIYQICKCYRDDPPTGIHLREFSMLEFYRVREDYRAIITDVKALVETVVGHSLAFEEITVRDLVLRHTGIDLRLTPNTETLRTAVMERALVGLAMDDDWEDIFFRVMIEKIEPALDPSRPLLVKDYPWQLGALAKRGASGEIVERFEIYWKGMELCNGCTELLDLDELRARFQREQANRVRRHKPPHPFPLRLEEAMSAGFPPCAGVAIGLDRLFWCLET